jgi:membrane protease YdiL (CAAX protease family)
MIPFAAIVVHEHGHLTELPILLEVVFMVVVLLCFLRVAGYAVRQFERGRLFRSDRGPLDFHISSLTAWIFIGGVLVLVFMQSFFYVFLVFMGMAGLLIENGRTADEQFGFRRLPPAKLLKWSLLVCGAVIFIETPLSRLWLGIMDAIHLPHPEQQSVETFREYKQPLEVIGFMVQAVILFPLIEELFFRGFLFIFLKRYTTTGLALVLSAGIFAFAHANLGAALPLWFLGVILGVAYQHTGSLLLPIGVHACWNLFTALSLIYDKGNG